MTQRETLSRRTFLKDSGTITGAAALAAVSVFAFVFFWNDFLGPLIILSTPENFTLTLFLANFSVAYRGTPWHLYMAAALIIILPCLILFFCSQNAFLKGITVTDLKG